MKAVRLLSLLISIAICLSVFAGCTPEPPVSNETTASTTASKVEETTEEITKNEVHPEIAKKDYGENFYFTVMGHVNEFDLHWVKEPKNNTLSDAIYNRQVAVKDYLGVDMYGVEESDPNAYITNFQTAVKNQDDSVHMLITHCYTGLDGFIAGNYFMDYNEMDHINLDADYWDLKVMEGVELKGHMFLGYSDFNIVRTNVVAFNKDMFKLYEDAIGEQFYDIVTDYRWTLDKMISISSLIYADTTADGKTKDDTFGLASDYEVPYASLIQASGLRIVELTEKGTYEIALYNDANKIRTSDLVDKLIALVGSESAYFDADPSFSPPYTVFQDGRALMYLSRTTHLPTFLDDDINFGVLPYPMFDEAQKDNGGYQSLQWGGFLAVPSYLKNPDMVFEAMEMMSFFSGDVNVAYYEKLLGKQVAEAPQDREMLDMVWNSVCSDFGLTYAAAMGTSFQWMLSAVTKPNSTYNLASYMASNVSRANKYLRGFMNKIK